MALASPAAGPGLAAVSPGNPLKPAAGMCWRSRPPGLGAARLADGRRLMATDIERGIGTRELTFQSAARARATRFPRARFVWLMGADNLAQLPRWRGWRGMAREQRRLRSCASDLHSCRAGRHRRRGGCAAGVCPRGAQRFGAWPLMPRRPGFSWHVRQNTPVPPAAVTARSPANPGRFAIARKPAAPPAAAAGKTQAARPADRPASAPRRPRHAAQEGRRRRPARQARSAGARRNGSTGCKALIVGSLEDDKAEDVVALDLAGRACSPTAW